MKILIICGAILAFCLCFMFMEDNSTGGWDD